DPSPTLTTGASFPSRTQVRRQRSGRSPVPSPRRKTTTGTTEESAGSPDCRTMRQSILRNRSWQPSSVTSKTSLMTIRSAQKLSTAVFGQLRVRPRSTLATDSDCEAQMKLQLSIYLEPDLMRQLSELAKSKGQPKSLV